jgi:peptide/nickel transport system substrate-binding protein
MAAEAGFEVKLRTMEFASTLDADDRGDFQAHLIGWSGRTDPDGNIYSFLHTGAPLNVSGYSSKEMDGLLEQSRTTTDVAGRKAIYAKIVAKTIEDAPLIYLYANRAIVGMSSKVNGFVQVPDGIIRLQGMSIGQ